LLFPLVAFAQQPAKPVLFIVHADWCPPCRVFDKTFSADEEFQTALRRAATLKELDWDKPADRDYAIRWLKADRVPTYVLVRDGRVVARHVGFTASIGPAAIEEAIREMMSRLNIEWPPAREQARPAPRAEPRVEPRSVGPTIDQGARDAIRNLSSEVTESTKSLRSQIESSSKESRTQLQTISETLQKSIESTRTSTREELQTIIRERIQAATGPNNSKATPDISTEIPGARSETTPSESAAGPVASKWLRVLAWAGKTGLAIAAPEIAIPGSIGLTVAGLGLRWLMKRKKPKPLGSVENPIRVADDGTVRTETKFVVSETDVLGEAFKEAIRRVGNTHRESSPHIVEVLKQVDSAATQLAHGKRVTRRPAMAPVSENDPR
jgi:thiol-disulfide isomerase/thioredoxin